jgi:hypothetical protein
VDIYTIIFLALAVFIFLRLRNVLGQRTGSERPPYDRPARNVIQGAQDNNVVPMPGTVIDQAPLAPTADVTPPTDRWKGVAEPGTPVAQGLDAIAALDSSFDPRHFLSGARSAYEMIVLAFANGDRRVLAAVDLERQGQPRIRDRARRNRRSGTRMMTRGKRYQRSQRQDGGDHTKRGGIRSAARASERFPCQPVSSSDRET